MHDGGRGKTAGQIVVTVLAILASLLAAAEVDAVPADPGRIAAIFPPWWSRAHAMTAAASAGDILAVGGASFVVILHGDPASLARRARAAGALFILSSDPAALCSSYFRESNS